MRHLRVIGLCLMTIVFGSLSARADTRVALVIGNGAYQNAPQLPNPAHDAADVAAALKRLGFETTLATDLDKNAMEDATIRFARAARNADVALFYYSGHAIQFSNTNYLVPIDAKLADEADLRRLVKVDDVTADLQQAKNLRILVLDSCRANPLADELRRSIGTTRGVQLQRGLARIERQEGMIVSYATQAGNTAEDGGGRNSPYTAAFLRYIEAQEEIGTIFRRISADVYETTKHTQLPELSLSLIVEYYLRGNLAPSTLTVDPCAGAPENWKSADAMGTKSALEDHLSRFPNCGFAALARARIDALKGPAQVATAAPPPLPNKNCDNPKALGIGRAIEIDTTGGPGFGFEHFKQFDFLRDHEVVLTFDDGPWPQNTPQVLKALADECTTAVFFPIGKHATYYPEILKQVYAAGHTVGTHTWSGAPLTNNRLSDDQRKDEIEKGVSAVKLALGGASPAPFFRFPALQHPPGMVMYLGSRNIAIFSCDLDPFDFKAVTAQQVIDATFKKLQALGKGIVYLHDFNRHTAEALPSILRRLKTEGYQIVAIRAKAPVQSLQQYDEELVKEVRLLSTVSQRPVSSVVTEVPR